MTEIVLVIHLLIAIALVATVLLQRSEGGALGIGGGGSLFSSRGVGNALTRTTAMLAVAFFVTSITLTIMARGGRAPTSVFDGAAQTQQPASQEGQPATQESQPAQQGTQEKSVLPNLSPQVPTGQ